VFLVSPLSSRNQIGGLLVEKGLCRFAAEVGTHRGDFAEVFLASWPGQLFCIDPWSTPDGYESQALQLWGGGDRNADMEYCRSRLAALMKATRTHGRAILMRDVSAKVVHKFSDYSLDFVHIDGDHRREMVRDDLQMWYQKLRSGGIIMGHDIVCPGEPGGHGRDVQRGLDDWLQLNFGDKKWDVPIHLIVEEDGLPWSFYLEKP
jgi:hypothetical protein